MPGQALARSQPEHCDFRSPIQARAHEQRPHTPAPDGLAIGTDAPGAVEAQEGTRREVARPIVPDELPDDLLEEIADAIGDYILEGLL